MVHHVIDHVDEFMHEFEMEQFDGSDGGTMAGLDRHPASDRSKSPGNSESSLEEIMLSTLSAAEREACEKKLLVFKQKKRQERIAVLTEMVNIEHELHSDNILLEFVDTATDSLQSILQHMCDELVRTRYISETVNRRLQTVLVEYEAEGRKAPMGHRLAIPVIYADLNNGDAESELSAPHRTTLFAFARLHHHIELGEADGQPIKFIFLIIGHESEAVARASSDSKWVRRAKMAELRRHVLCAEAMSFLISDEEFYRCADQQ